MRSKCGSVTRLLTKYWAYFPQNEPFWHLYLWSLLPWVSVFCFFCSELSHKIKQHAVKIHINILIFSLLLGCNLKSNCRFGDMFLKKFTHFYWPSQIDTNILSNLFYSLIPLTLHVRIYLIAFIPLPINVRSVKEFIVKKKVPIEKNYNHAFKKSILKKSRVTMKNKFNLKLRTKKDTEKSRWKTYPVWGDLWLW